MIRCEHCGSNYQHSIRNRNGFTEDYWICASRRKGNIECTAKGYIPTEILKRETAAVLEMDSFDEDAFHERVDYISVPAHRVLIYHMKDGREIKREWRSTAKKDCWTEESKNKMKDWMLKYMGSTDCQTAN